MRSAWLGAAALALLIGAAPAAAQFISLDPPDGHPDKEYFAIGGGAFDALQGENVAGEVRAELRFGYKLFGLLKPFIGGSVTTERAVYGYGGFGVDIYLGQHLVLTPNAAVGAFDEGDGRNLGSIVEFRTGAELAWRFEDRSRLGIAVHHISNAGITERNPGTETVLIVYSIPLFR